MGAGFTWMDSSLKRCGRERIGRDEEGTSSGRAVLGGYTAILKRSPDTQDLLTATDSEVLCRLVRRWIGQGGKASLANTADADILEFIIGKLRARIQETATNGQTERHGWYIRTMTGPLINGRKAVGVRRFEIQREGGQQSP